jgi:hypothetical protein
MKYILDKLIEILSGGNIIFSIVIIAIALIFNYKKIIDFFEERKKARIVKITEALECKHVTGATRVYLEEELETEQFKITTGIRLEKQFREAVIKAHKSMNGEVVFMHFKRALPHLLYKQGVLSVEITTFELISYWFHLIFGFILGFSGLALMVLSNQIKGINFIQLIIFFGIGCFFVVVALFMLNQTLPVVSAQKIKKYLFDETHNDK